MRSPEDLLKIKEVADQYRVSTATIRRWVERGQIAASKLPNGSLRFRRADVEAVVTPVGGPPVVDAEPTEVAG